MIYTIVLGNKTINYDLVYKKVKNINLRITQDGKIRVSANPSVPRIIIEEFIASKEARILSVLEKLEKIIATPPVQYYSEAEVKELILSLCQKIYPYFQLKGVKYPEIKFRKMKSCWGNCRSYKGILTFNTNLMYAPPECVEYVVCHEFTHFLQPDHSVKFYEELKLVCPDWKIRREKLKTIVI